MGGGGRRALRQLVVGVLLGAGVVVGLSEQAGAAATTATFANGVLSVFGDSDANTITIGRDTTGAILVDAGAVVVAGGNPTVATTTLIQVSGLGGDDALTLDESNGPLPPANLFGGSDQDTLIGGSGADHLFGQGGNDTLSGLAGTDGLFGGRDNDTLSGGEGNDQVFGESDNDRLLWNAGDDTDVDEGGPGIDSVEVRGSDRSEVFAAAPNGSQVRFAGLEPEPFGLDIATSEDLFVLANGGEDTFSASGALGALIRFTVDGGPDRDTLLGSDGPDLLIGGDGDDFVDGQQGDDTAFLGARDDTFQWDPGDGSDSIAGDEGTDTMVFNGSNAAEIFQASATGERMRFTRNLANIVMDTADVETIDLRALGGIDTLTVDDLTTTDLVDLEADLAAAGGQDDGQPDTVVVRASDDEDTAIITGTGTDALVTGLRASVSVSGAQITDRLVVQALAGDDVVDASGLGGVVVTLDGGEDDDVLIGGDLDDSLLGGDGDDVLIGGDGLDTLDGGPGQNVVLQDAGTGGDRVEP
jgi:Ca2+-binding RTX toxin-like protein